MVVVRFRVEMPPAQEAANPGPTVVWRNHFIPIVAVLLFIYVGTENSVGGWVASYAKRIDPAAATLWAMIPSVFWGALLIGRASAPVFLRHLAETGLARASLAMALAGIVTLLSSRTVDSVILGSAMAGLGLAPIYPTSISLMPRWFGASTAQVAGVLFAVGNAGGGVLPWFVGMLSKHFDSLRAGFFVPLAGAILMLSFYVLHKVPESRS
jgi:fucose permease